MEKPLVVVCYAEDEVEGSLVVVENGFRPLSGHPGPRRPNPFMTRLDEASKKSKFHVQLVSPARYPVESM